MTALVLGIDGGGTGCRAAVAAAHGPVLGMGHAGPANILTDPERAAKHIEEAARAALAHAGLSPDVLRTVPAFLGLAGNNEPQAAERVTALLPFPRLEIASDGLIALEGAFSGRDGAIASLGTGTVFLLRLNGEVRQFGGWGFFLGDGGSGARIGQEALRQTLRAHDGILTPSSLTEDLFRQFGRDPGAMLAFARNAAPGDFARFAPAVFGAADAGDPVAAAVIAEAAQEVNAVLDRMLDLSGPGRLCLAGGLKSLYPDHLAERHRARLAEPEGDALDGAIRLARSTFLATEAVS